MKIVTIIGARPQFIKAAVVSKEIKNNKKINEVIVHTGQHFDSNMSDIFFEQMGIPKPNYQLEISGLTHGAMTGRMLEEIEKILLKEQPDYVMVYGDTNSTLAGALAASKLNIKVAHVEAGLRSFNMSMPEEQNRILTDRISSVLFCPTKSSLINLDSEGYESLNIDILKVGDVMQDSVLFYKNYSKSPDDIDVDKFDNGFILSTVHRAENTDDPDRLRFIVSALNKVHESTPVVLPLHPRTRNKIAALGLDLEVHVIEPVGYLEMLYLLDNCSMVMCDSGGLQKEAYFFGKPCITMRDETEWVELVEVNANVIVGASFEKITSAYEKMKNVEVTDDEHLYGGGNASKAIVDYFCNQR
ncbi:non-hydrolyzing UDP-N-acetylglucosamine 2-epimerase [Vibrio sp. HN007]|uniref:non-hydrolyzing UDP-N-acetylglucosamine 2-epimerase n=1 Tax=Vibrio iocasae TaxID=3098914 RepID=UPI0035D3FCCD